MNISHRAFVVYAYLADRVNENGECCPAVKRIASDTKMSETTICRVVHELRKEKLIKTNSTTAITERKARYYFPCLTPKEKRKKKRHNLH